MNDLYYFFTDTEQDARISATGKALQSLGLDAIKTDFEKSIYEKLRTFGHQNDQIKKYIDEHNLLNHISLQLLDYCINLTYETNFFDEILNLLRDLRKDVNLRKVLKDFDRKSGLHYFSGGVERAVSKYKSRLMKMIFITLDNMGYEKDKNKPGRLKEHYIVFESKNNKETFENYLYNMCFEQKDYLGDEQVFLND